MSAKGKILSEVGFRVCGDLTDILNITKRLEKVHLEDIAIAFSKVYYDDIDLERNSYNIIISAHNENRYDEQYRSIVLRPVNIIIDEVSLCKPKHSRFDKKFHPVLADYDQERYMTLFEVPKLDLKLKIDHQPMLSSLRKKYNA